MLRLSRFLLALTLLVTAQPMLAQETREISGSATYLARMALPPGAELAAEARGFAGESLGIDQHAIDGAQVPLAFALEIPARVPAELRLAILLEGGVRWLSAPVEIAPGVDDVDLGEIEVRPFRPYGFASELVCGAVRLRLGFADNAALLDTGGAVIELAPVPTASGAKFDSADGLTSVWTKGDEAMVTLAGAELAPCRIVPPDAAFLWRARGNEPGWTLTLQGGLVTLVTNYGADTRTAQLPDPEIEDGAYVYAFDDPEMRLTVTEALCHDDMTGMPYPQTVSIDSGEGELSGCGGEPFELLTGAVWSVAEIAGEGVAEGSEVTLHFGRDGALSGTAGCNRYAGQVAITGEGLAIAPAGATMMACDEDLMAQERRFFDALAGVTRFDIDATGALVLIASGETVLKASR